VGWGGGGLVQEASNQSYERAGRITGVRGPFKELSHAPKKNGWKSFGCGAEVSSWREISAGGELNEKPTELLR